MGDGVDVRQELDDAEIEFFVEVRGQGLEDQCDQYCEQVEEEDYNEDVVDLHAKLGDFGRYRVTTPTEVEAFLAAAKWTSGGAVLPNQRDVFNAAALRLGMSRNLREFFLSHFAAFGTCRACLSNGPCEHFPAATSMPEELLLKVPLIFDTSTNEPVVSVFCLPGTLVIESWLSDAVISQSIVTKILERGVVHPGNASFCAGAYFEELVKVVPQGTLPLCIAAYSDATCVVGVGQRSFHVASLALLNSSLSSLDTVRPVMFLPEIEECVVGLSKAQLRNMRLQVFHIAWEVVAQTLKAETGDEPLCMDRVGGQVHVYPSICLFVGDTPEINRVQGHRNGGSTEELCLRCRATAARNDFGEFQLRLDRKEEIDGLLQRIVDKDGAKVARTQLKKISVNEVVPFGDNLRHFDTSLCCPTCSLHVGRILFTKTLLQHIGAILHTYQNQELEERQAAPGGRKRARLAKEDNLLALTNAQFRLFVPESKTLFGADGELDLSGLKTGKFLSKIAHSLPFVLYNILPKELEYLEVAAIEWSQCLRLWLKPGKSLKELEDLQGAIVKARATFVNLAAKAGAKSPLNRPTFHSLLHASTDQWLFGDDCVVSTQAFEQSHAQLVKKRFQLETNKTRNHDSIVQQIFDGLFQRSFMVRAAEAASKLPVRMHEGLVSIGKLTTVEGLVRQCVQWENMVSVLRDKLVEQVQLVLAVHGHWTVETAGIGITPENAPCEFYWNQQARRATGYRTSQGQVLRAFDGKAASKNCIAECRNGTFVLCF